jgi:hypothetical protein
MAWPDTASPLPCLNGGGYGLGSGVQEPQECGSPEHARHTTRRDFQANPINAVVVRKWRGKDYGPGGKTVVLTNARVEQPLQPFDDYDDRRLIENCYI